MMRWLTFFGLFFVTVLQAQPLKVNIKSKSAILINPENGAILFEKNAHEPRFPASIMKVATALFVLDAKKIDLKAFASASKKALKIIPANIKQAEFDKYPSYLIEHDGTIMGLVPGETYSYETLLHGLLIASANDAANVIAENCSRSIDDFMHELNAYIKEKGCTRTVFKNPHGLLHPEQVTTAFEMAKITSLALKVPQLSEILFTRSYEWKRKKKGNTTLRTNILMFKEGRYYYPKLIAAKTGYTADAGYNMVAVAENKGRRLIAVILGGETKESRYLDAINLFEEAFREEQNMRILFNKDFDRFSTKVSRAKQTLQGYLKQDITMNYFPSEEPHLQAEIVWEKLSCPVNQDQIVGYLNVSDQNKHMHFHEPIFAAQNVEKKWFFRCMEFIHHHLALLMLGGIFFLGLMPILRMQAKK